MAAVDAALLEVLEIEASVFDEFVLILFSLV
jgi:hypothetical protein